MPDPKKKFWRPPAKPAKVSDEAYKEGLADALTDHIIAALATKGVIIEEDRPHKMGKK